MGTELVDKVSVSGEQGGSLLIQTGDVVVPRNSSEGAYVASACHILVDLSTSWGGTSTSWGGMPNGNELGGSASEFCSHGLHPTAILTT